MEIKGMGVKNEKVIYGVVTLLSALVFLIFLAMLTGKGLFDANTYNTYALQANAWKHGRLELPQNYEWLELAIYEGKYYCSFPPFPSYVLFPFTFLFGSSTPDALILWLVDFVTVLYLYKLALLLKQKPMYAMLEALFLFTASNLVFLLVDPSVWFLAQSMCFTLAVLSIYYACRGKGTLSLLFWACSVGCRPMQIVYVPVIFLILWKKIEEKEGKVQAESLLQKVQIGTKRILARWRWAVPGLFIALSYMLLNYLRFGNALEFGRKYLPEFVNAEKGQFHLDYAKDNLQSLFGMPEFNEEGRMLINPFGELNFLIVNPILIFAVLLFFYVLIKKRWQEAAMTAVIFLLSAGYLFIVIMHRTMGAWQFGNRYAIDILPWVYLPVCAILGRSPRMFKWQLPFMLFGLCLNVVGTIVVQVGMV